MRYFELFSCVEQLHFTLKEILVIRFLSRRLFLPEFSVCLSPTSVVESGGKKAVFVQRAGISSTPLATDRVENDIL